MDYNQINSFLSFGYVPQVSTKFLEPIIEDLNYFKNLKKVHSKKSESYLIKQGISILNNIVKSHLTQYKNIEKHLLPLSGGLDSRLILAVLLNHIESKDIIALTYGVNGALDYEIPQLLTSKLGIEHKLVNLEDLAINETDLAYSLKTGASNVELITAFYNRRWLKEMNKNRLLWSGFLGGELAGSHFEHIMLKMNWTDSLDHFATTNTWVRKESNMLTDAKFEIAKFLPKEPLIKDPMILTYAEQLDLSIRQTSWILKIVGSGGNKFICPCMHPEWIRFMLSLPSELRENKKFYGHLAYKYNIDLFSIKTKSVPGGYIKRPIAIKIKQLRDSFWLARQKLKKRAYHSIDINDFNLRSTKPNRNLNYLDFNQAFRKKDDFILLAELNLKELDKSELTPWINAFDFLKLHHKGNEDYSQEILLLISLNAHFKLKFFS